MELINQYADWQMGEPNGPINKARCPDLAVFAAAMGTVDPKTLYAAIRQYATPAVTQEYVVGFAFTPNSRVVLIEKQRPDWQRGKLNGVGGKVEIGEGFHAAMAREFYEETGVEHNDWRLAGIMHGDDWRAYVMTATSEAFWVAKTTTDEKVALHPTGAVKTPYATGNLLDNVASLVTLCDLAASSPSGTVPFFTLRY